MRRLRFTYPIHASMNFLLALSGLLLLGAIRPMVLRLVSHYLNRGT